MSSLTLSYLYDSVLFLSHPMIVLLNFFLVPALVITLNVLQQIVRLPFLPSKRADELQVLASR